MNRFLTISLFVLPTYCLHAGEFAPDAHTLMLAHFDDNVHRADYALGMSHFAGNGARLVEGYYGRAIDLRSRGLHEDFGNTCEDYTPRYDGWGFHPRANVDPWQGTFECWFQVADPKHKLLPGGGGFMNATLARSIKHPDRDYYASFNLGIIKPAIRYTLPTLSEKCFIGNILIKAVPGYERYLEPAEWHHLALCWSQGEMVLWLDGRPLASFDMTGQLGLAILSNPVRYIQMSDCLLDELHISNVVRYSEPFEPNWRDGKRPDYAFTGTPDVPRYDPKPLPTAVPHALPAKEQMDSVNVELGHFELRFGKNDGRLIGQRHFTSWRS